MTTTRSSLSHGDGWTSSWSLVPDAELAALAVEHGAELVSFDRDFARFPGLRWVRPDLGGAGGGETST